MKRLGFGIKLIISFLSVLVIVVLLVFGSSIPGWLGWDSGTPALSSSPSGLDGYEISSSEEAVTREQQEETTAETEDVYRSEESEEEGSTEVSESEDEETATADKISAEETSEAEITVEAAAQVPEGTEDPYIGVCTDSIVVTAEEKKNLAAILLESGELEANDGTGNANPGEIHYELEQMYLDAAGALTVEKGETVKDGFYQITFTLTDRWNREASCTSILVVADEVKGPVLTLNVRSVTLKAGETFQYLKYIEKASDPNDGDIGQRVQLEGGDFDTNVPGTYQVKYYVRNLSGVRSPRATLLVTVE